MTFQSPSLRGSGLFAARAHPVSGIARRFNPLHCGAVVSSDRRSHGRRMAGLVSIPFIAGQWSLRKSAHDRKRPTAQFQSPSLRGSGLFRSGKSNQGVKPRRFNPLHCGAVVSSAGPPPGQRRPDLRFNPLHCGAVVSSRPGKGAKRKLRHVSIPFIAGQWSLPSS